MPICASSRLKQWCQAILLVSLLAQMGCIASSSNSSGSGSQVAVSVSGPTTPVSISVSTATPSTAQFTATVTGSSNTAVNWSVASASGSGCTTSTPGGIGTVSGSGLYTAPNTIPTTALCQVVVTATSQADSTASGQALVSVYMQVSVTLSGPGTSPFSIPVSTGATPSTAQFTATVTGALNTAVSWSLAGNTGSGCGTLGTITSDGLYTAPSTITTYPCQVIITATSQADSNVSAQVLVGVHVVVTISPSVSQTIGQSANLQFTATVTGTTNQSVNWSATSNTANVGGGIFDNSNPGLYVAPTFPSGVTTSSATLTATSDFDNSQDASVNMTVNSTDPLGTPTASSIACPSFGGGLTGSTCFEVMTNCPGVANLPAYLKVNTPPDGAVVKGTVIFGTGTGGTNLYDYDPDFITSGGYNGGLYVVQNILSTDSNNDGYNTVQVSFGGPFDSTQINGWLQGPGGVRRLACRYAEVANWVYNNPTMINPNSAAETSAPMCATGNSGGSGAIGYTVYEYGLGSDFAMIEPTSGPVMTRIDQGCSPVGMFSYGGTLACTNDTSLDMSYSIGSGDDSTAAVIDAAYQTPGATTPTLCSDGVNGTSSANANRFKSDSIEYAPSNSIAIPLPSSLTVKVLFGGTDTSNAVPQGETWWGGAAPKPTQQCVVDAPHAIPSVPDGAAQIVTDITTLCK